MIVSLVMLGCSVSTPATHIDTSENVSSRPVVPVPIPAPPAPAVESPGAPLPPKPVPVVRGPLPRASALPEAGAVPYAELVASIEAARLELAAAQAHEEAETFLYDAVTTRLIPAWKGTPWTFYGHAEAPGDEPIACGYWVASVLRDVGFRVDRDHVGKQASELILRTFAPAPGLRHFGVGPYTTVVSWAARQGKGLWGVGLANHAGLLWNDGEEVRFCHSNYNGQRGPMCENALFSGPFRTSYTVLASMLASATVDAWLAGAPLATGEFPIGGI